MLPAWLEAAKTFIVGAKTAIITGLCVAAVCLPLGYCKGERAATAKWDAARSLANTKALEIDGTSKEAAAGERVADALAVERNEEELLDAIATVEDTVPDASRVALGCQRLRTQGTAEADLPAICRP